MKRFGEFVKREISGEILLIPTGKTAETFNGIITLSEVGDFIWEHIEEVDSFDALLNLILEEYDIDKETLAKDTSAFMNQLIRVGMIRPETERW